MLLFNCCNISGFLVCLLQVHPVLMLIGYIILGSEGNSNTQSYSLLVHLWHISIKRWFLPIHCMSAIMIYKVFPKLNHDTAKLTHLILHAIATVLGAFAIYCVFKYHNDSGIANLYSLHSWLGIGTISLYGIQVTHYTPAPPCFAKILQPSCPSYVLAGGLADRLSMLLAVGVRVRDLLPRRGTERVAQRAALAHAVQALRLRSGAGDRGARVAGERGARQVRH
jgi:hypothetical protein